MKEFTEIVLENERLIYKIASYFPMADMDDLYQAGVSGMLLAYRNYDASKAKFTTYAYSYILGEMKKVIRDDSKIKISRDMRTLRGKVILVKEKLTQVLMREPSSLEISSYLEIPEEIVLEALSSLSFKSIDENVGDTNMMLHEIIGKSYDYDTLLFLKMEIESLEEPERSIMIERYYEDMTQTEVASSLGLTQARVSRCEQKVLSKLRQNIN